MVRPCIDTSWNFSRSIASFRILKWDNPSEWMESPVAKLKFIRSADKWRLYWQPSDLKWHEYPGLSSSDRLSDLVQAIDDDPLACFFG